MTHAYFFSIAMKMFGFQAVISEIIKTLQIKTYKFILICLVLRTLWHYMRREKRQSLWGWVGEEGVDVEKWMVRERIYSLVTERRWLVKCVCEADVCDREAKECGMVWVKWLEMERGRGWREDREERRKEVGCYYSGIHEKKRERNVPNILCWPWEREMR